MNGEDEFRADEMYSLRCYECRYHKCDAERDGVESTCKRIDHKTIRFYTPWFRSYDCGTQHLICRDFEPDLFRWPRGDGIWKGYDDYRALMKETGEAWASDNRESVSKRLWFRLSDDGFKTIYEVDTEDFINGTMIQDGYLRARRRIRCKPSRDSVTGYRWIYEDIDRVKLPC